MALIMSVKGKDTTIELSERNNKISQMKTGVGNKDKSRNQRVRKLKVRCKNLKALNFFQADKPHQQKSREVASKEKK